MPADWIHQKGPVMRNVASLFLEYARLDRKRTGVGLSVKQLERWSELKSRLERELSQSPPSAGAERRDSIRVPTRLNCAFESIGMLQKAVITNFSRTGMFINTSSPLSIGSKLLLSILIEETGSEIEVTATVATNNVGPSFDLKRKGMGVCFTQDVPEITEKIDNLYEQEIARVYGDGDESDSSAT